MSIGKKFSQKPSSGFSIIEVIFAITVFTLSFLVMMTIFPFGLIEEKKAEQTTIATNLAQAKIEELMSVAYDQLTIGTTTEASLAGLDADFAIYSRQAVISYVDGNLQPAVADTDLKKIKVLVSWFNQSKNATSTVALNTLIPKQ